MIVRRSYWRWSLLEAYLAAVSDLNGALDYGQLTFDLVDSRLAQLL